MNQSIERICTRFIQTNLHMTYTNKFAHGLNKQIRTRFAPNRSEQLQPIKITSVRLHFFCGMVPPCLKRANVFTVLCLAQFIEHNRPRIFDHFAYCHFLLILCDEDVGGAEAKKKIMHKVLLGNDVSIPSHVPKNDIFLHLLSVFSSDNYNTYNFLIKKSMNLLQSIWCWDSNS